VNKAPTRIATGVAGCAVFAELGTDGRYPRPCHGAAARSRSLVQYVIGLADGLGPVAGGALEQAATAATTAVTTAAHSFALSPMIAYVSDTA
jgi:hypothetical protein